MQNGLKNTWKIINTKTTKKWADYVNIAQNGFTGATPPTSANIMTTTGTNPMFECLSRNRDLNGDGKIDEDEVRWYLPSVRQCIFAWCGKKSLPTEISFETTNYATSTNLGFRIWWALEGTAISSWDNKDTNPMIRCVRNLGTNSTSGEVSDITSWDQENYVVTVNGLKDETLRTNMESESILSTRISMRRVHCLRHSRSPALILTFRQAERTPMLLKSQLASLILLEHQ